MAPRSLAIQSVLYLNQAEDIIRAAEASANSVRLAHDAGLISDWSLVLGDCSPKPVLSPADLERISEHVSAAGGSLHYTPFGENLGSAAGHNALAALADSELMLILNPDAIVAPDTVSALARTVVDAVGIAEARQIPLEHPKDYAKYSGDTPWASTACALTPRFAFDQVGGFDAETFFLYCDDVDYSWRLRLAGFRVVYEPAARVFHDKRLTITGDWPASAAEIYYSAEAAMLLAWKYSRPQLAKGLAKQYRREGSDAVLKAVEEFERRSSEGRLPRPIDAGHQVGVFTNGNYAEHRY